MTVKELIELLAKTNQDATVIVDEDWSMKSMAENDMHESSEYAQKELYDSKISEVEMSDDKTYVRIW